MAAIAVLAMLVVGGVLLAQRDRSSRVAETPHSGTAPPHHVHGMALENDELFVATHEGLYHYSKGRSARVGPVIDLMGFTAVGPRHFYASGHPGPGVDLPSPVGLLESLDAGQTWTPLSRQGESDFHTLTSSSTAILGFDGKLRASADGRVWREERIPAQPFSLAGSPGGETVLATTEQGPLRSTDSGASWSSVANAPLLLVVTWAGPSTAVGVTPDGQVAVSEDAGVTWVLRGRVPGGVQAVAATRVGSTVRVVVSTKSDLLDSLDGGATFRVFGQ